MIINQEKTPLDFAQGDDQTERSRSLKMNKAENKILTNSNLIYENRKRNLKRTAN
jgi:hypothetical protein